MQSATLSAQQGGKPEPRFTISISEYFHDFGRSTHRLRVIITNTSNDGLHIDGCGPMRGLYDISVLYNGVPLEEKDISSRHHREDETRHTFCVTDTANSKLPPGATIDDFLSLIPRYDMSKPGSYEVTVGRETYPYNPEKSVTVKSNTLTIIVPEPETGTKQ